MYCKKAQKCQKVLKATVLTRVVLLPIKMDIK